jgi:methylated-DNA-[protein]-cysteine S-methyltransferase
MTKLKNPGTREPLPKCTKTYKVQIDSPLGKILVLSDSIHLTGLYFVGCAHVPTPENHPDWQHAPELELFARVSRQLHEYFANTRTSFDLPYKFAHGTAFQQKVWHALAKIPYGTTKSYRELAAQIGKPTGSRAVANAIGKNPLSIIIPCHRIIGSNGSLTGYAGGLERKQALLALEKKI